MPRTRSLPAALRSAETVGEILAIVRGTDVPDSAFDSLTISTIPYRNTLHAGPWPRCGLTRDQKFMSQWRGSQNCVPMTLRDLEQLRVLTGAQKLCADCFTGKALRMGLRDTGNQLGDLCALLRMRCDLERAVATTENRAPAGMAQLLSSADRLRYRARIGSYLPATVVADVDALAAQLRENMSGSDGVKESLLASVRAELGTEVLDDADTLVGVTNLSYMRSHALARGLLDSFALSRKGTATLAILPRYASDYILARGFQKKGNVRATSAPAPQDPEILEAVASLWDPESEGALASVYAAVEAAVAVLRKPVAA